MFGSFGKWMTKTGALILASPQIGNLIGNALNGHDAISPDLEQSLISLGTILALLGIRRAIR